MTTLTIHQSDLLDALMCLNHISGCPHRFGHTIAFDPTAMDAQARLLCPMGLSSSPHATYLEDYHGDAHLDPQDCLDPDYQYTWGDADAIRADHPDIGPDDEIPESIEQDYQDTARRWLRENLLTRLDLDGKLYQLDYR